jgi:hypothetical protein
LPRLRIRKSIVDIVDFIETAEILFYIYINNVIVTSLEETRFVLIRFSRSEELIRNSKFAQLLL